MRSPDDIARASASWVWHPRGSEHDDQHLHLVRYPARFGGGVRASQIDTDLDAAEVVSLAIDRTRAWGENRLVVWVGAADRPDVEDELRRIGAVHDDTVTVFARPLPGDPIPVPDDVTVEIVRTMDQVRDVDAVNVPVWEQAPLDAEGLRAEHVEVTTALESGEGCRVLSRIDGRPVGTGGCTVVDGFLRLWGAATLREVRGRGAYRAVLAERLRWGAAQGADTALVKGRVETSAPILSRAGFRRFGEERSYSIRL